jgi:hypothetical protein
MFLKKRNISVMSTEMKEMAAKPFHEKAILAAISGYCIFCNALLHRRTFTVPQFNV